MNWSPEVLCIGFLAVVVVLITALLWYLYKHRVKIIIERVERKDQ